RTFDTPPFHGLWEIRAAQPPFSSRQTVLEPPAQPGAIPSSAVDVQVEPRQPCGGGMDWGQRSAWPIAFGRRCLEGKESGGSRQGFPTSGSSSRPPPVAILTILARVQQVCC